jgi:hypothetical protein
MRVNLHKTVFWGVLAATAALVVEKSLRTYGQYPGDEWFLSLLSKLVTGLVLNGLMMYAIWSGWRWIARARDSSRRIKAGLNRFIPAGPVANRLGLGYRAVIEEKNGPSPAGAPMPEANAVEPVLRWAAIMRWHDDPIPTEPSPHCDRCGNPEWENAVVMQFARPRQHTITVCDVCLTDGERAAVVERIRRRGGVIPRIDFMPTERQRRRSENSRG